MDVPNGFVVRQVPSKDPYRLRQLGALRYQAIHRISFSEDDGAGGYWPGVHPISDAELSGEGLIERFHDARRVPPEDRRDPEWRDRPGALTGGKEPYALLLRQDGSVDQLAPFTAQTPHGRSYNPIAVGIAVAGDFRRHSMSAAQQDTLIKLCALLRATGLMIIGHDEIPDGSADARKQCPGRYLDVEDLRIAVRLHPWASVPPAEATEFLTDRLGLGMVA